MTLDELQRRFAASVIGGSSLDDVDEKGMRVYANNYRGQLMAVLRDTYEKTRLWLGDDAFDAEASRYIDRHAPSSWTLDAYGEAFPDLLGASFPDDPDVSELAWLDRALHHAFREHDALAMSPGGLVASDWDRVEFTFVPSLRFRRLSSNAVAIWKALADEVMPPAAAQLEDGGGVRVWREGLSPQFVSMPAHECSCLDFALAGATFGEICELVRRRYGAGAVATTAGALLRAWAADGLIVQLRQG